ncbi:MAG: serine/threonine-protein kinase, partial [Proteobacteria bacterium]|nr:serine/threonine-protein kinase [Pseudomonadota bacterium]
MTDADPFLQTMVRSRTVAETIADAPRSTIIPEVGHSTAGTRAMAVLSELSGGALAGTGKLALGDIIGQGGMGVIRAAEQVALGRTVAVKTLKPDRRDPSAALDLLREAWVTGSLEHPNIVPVHFLELDEHGMPVIVLKRIAGSEWSSLYNDPGAVATRFGKHDLLAWNLDILLDVLNALRFAHSRGIVHRDLKPSNVMIGDFGEVYLLDWGIAVSLTDDGSGRIALATDATSPAGTPCYMAPEMLGNAGPITAQTDVYLAGAVLFELISGKPPHEGDSAAEVIASIMTSQPRLPDGVPGELAAICARAMERDPTRRFPSVGALRKAIQTYLEHRGSSTIAARAQTRLDELVGLLALVAPGAHADGNVNDAAYRLFGACRFGFHEALSVWPENPDARAGLVRATCVVAEYELASANPEAAIALLRDVADAPPSLVARARTAA